MSEIEDNKALVRRLVEIVNSGDLDEADIFRVEGGKLAAALAVVEDDLKWMGQLGLQD